jgi:hypothetical protein
VIGNDSQPAAPSFDDGAPPVTADCLPAPEGPQGLLDTFTAGRTGNIGADPRTEADGSYHVNTDGSSYALENGELYWINETGARHFISDQVTSFQAIRDGTMCYRQAGGGLVLWPARGGHVPVADGVTMFRITDDRRIYFLRTTGTLYGFREGDPLTFQAGGVTHFEATPDGRVFFLDADSNLMAFRPGTINSLLAEKVRSFALARDGKLLFHGTDRVLYGWQAGAPIARLLDGADRNAPANGSPAPEGANRASLHV